MPESIPFPILPPAGVIKSETDAVVEGRWKDTQWVRFVDGKPEKMGGYNRVSLTTTDGIPRALHAWRDLGFIRYVAAATYRKLYVYEYLDWTQHDITPIAASGTLGNNPFTTTSGSPLVSVASTTHGRSVGDIVIFSGATAVAGITINGTYIVTSVTSAGVFVITHTSNANASTSGGGNAVAYEYEITTGVEASGSGYGYGVGRYGVSTYGDPRGESEVRIEARVWSFDNYGENLLATYNGGKLYQWDPDNLGAGTRATALTNAPSNVRFVFVTEERFIMALCEDMLVKWPSQDDSTDWTPSDTNTANQRRLQIGTRLVGGKALGNNISLIWTDATVYQFQYTGSASVFSSRSRGKNCGLAGPHAAVVDQRGHAYWMSNNSFHVFNGAVQEVPNVADIKYHVFGQFRPDQGALCWAHYNAAFDEIVWFYVVSGEIATRYVIYNIKDQAWAHGTFERTAGTSFSSDETRPLFASSDGYIYLHEIGYDDHNGAAIKSYITLAPYAIEEGRGLMEVDGYIGDFVDQIGDLAVDFVGYDRLRQAPIDEQSIVVGEANDFVDMRLCARHVGMTITSNEVGGFFRYGKPKALIKPNGLRR